MTARKALTKAEVITQIAEDADLTKKQVNQVFDSLVSLVADELKAAGTCLLPGIGKSVLADRKARTGRNPSTGETIQIPAKTVVKLKLAKAFQDTVVPS